MPTAAPKAAAALQPEAAAEGAVERCGAADAATSARAARSDAVRCGAPRPCDGARKADVASKPLHTAAPARAPENITLRGLLNMVPVSLTLGGLLLLQVLRRNR